MGAWWHCPGATRLAQLGWEAGLHQIHCNHMPKELLHSESFVRIFAHVSIQSCELCTRPYWACFNLMMVSRMSNLIKGWYFLRWCSFRPILIVQQNRNKTPFLFLFCKTVVPYGRQNSDNYLFSFVEPPKNHLQQNWVSVLSGFHKNKTGTRTFRMPDSAWKPTTTTHSNFATLRHSTITRSFACIPLEQQNRSPRHACAK